MLLLRPLRQALMPSLPRRVQLQIPEPARSANRRQPWRPGRASWPSKGNMLRARGRPHLPRLRPVLRWTDTANRYGWFTEQRRLDWLWFGRTIQSRPDQQTKGSPRGQEEPAGQAKGICSEPEKGYVFHACGQSSGGQSDGLSERYGRFTEQCRLNWLWFGRTIQSRPDQQTEGSSRGQEEPAGQAKGICSEPEEDNVFHASAGSSGEHSDGLSERYGRFTEQRRLDWLRLGRTIQSRPDQQTEGSSRGQEEPAGQAKGICSEPEEGHVFYACGRSSGEQSDGLSERYGRFTEQRRLNWL